MNQNLVMDVSKRMLHMLQLSWLKHTLVMNSNGFVTIMAKYKLDDKLDLGNTSYELKSLLEGTFSHFGLQLEEDQVLCLGWETNQANRIVAQIALWHQRGEIEDIPPVTVFRLYKGREQYLHDLTIWGNCILRPALDTCNNFGWFGSEKGVRYLLDLDNKKLFNQNILKWIFPSECPLLEFMKENPIVPYNESRKEFFVAEPGGDFIISFQDQQENK